MCCDGTIINPGLVRNQGTSESTGGTVIEDEEEEITGKVTTALWGYAFLPLKALMCGLIDYKWRHRGDF